MKLLDYWLFVGKDSILKRTAGGWGRDNYLPATESMLLPKMA